MESSAQRRRQIEINEDVVAIQLDADTHSASGAGLHSRYLDLGIMIST